jgi:hypothetical protein
VAKQVLIDGIRSHPESWALREYLEKCRTELGPEKKLQIPPAPEESYREKAIAPVDIPPILGQGNGDSTLRTISEPQEILRVDAEEPIISKTLAEIYEKQGVLEEAVKTYRLLKARRPQQAEEFERRIIDLEARIQAKRNGSA